MYSACIFCSAKLGRNESVEEFPVGRTLAFDAVKGRLWAVCGSCGRWNLAPIHERWEAVETSEKLFADARLKVQSENVGMAKLRDGTRLVRIGRAEAHEVAGWRYGALYRSRHRTAARAARLGTLAMGGAWLAQMAGGPVYTVAAGAGTVALCLWSRRLVRKTVHRVTPAGDSQAVTVRRRDLPGAGLRTEGGKLVLTLDVWVDGCEEPRRVLLRGAQARETLARAMVYVNRPGAPAPVVSRAVDGLAESGGAERYLAHTAARQRILLPGLQAAGTGSDPFGVRAGVTALAFALGHSFASPPAPGTADAAPPSGLLRADEALGLEMALHEETERRAMAGELVMLEIAWRDAEEIARIADALPGAPPETDR
ncbi:MAG TPA: hypothetical protein VFE05_13475 [Longimicrobiaceae bacterium]|nr:hypothetical protein [Longimicrobiaceae bacterium]